MKGRARRYTTKMRRELFGTERNGEGAPTLLTPEVQEKIVQLVRAGNYFATACGVAGVAYSTVMEWIQRGEDLHARGNTPEHKAFAEAVRKAQAEQEALLVNAVRMAAEVDPKGQPKGSRHWMSAAWLLERKYPKHWSRQDTTIIRHEHDVIPGPVVATSIEGTSPDDAREALKRGLEVLARAEARAQKCLLPKKDK